MGRSVSRSLWPVEIWANIYEGEKMTSIELASLVSGWSAVLIPVMLLTGTVLAVYQLRVGAKARRLQALTCLLYTSPSPRDGLLSRMPSSA